MELTKLKGIGKKREESFFENDIFSCEDLTNYFPYKYYDFSKTEPYADDGNVRLIKATAIDSPKLVRARKNLSFVSCKMNDEVGHTFNAVWFNQTYIKSVLYLGINVYLYGKNSPNKKNTFNVLMMKKEEDVQKLGSSLLPIYHSIDGIGQTSLHTAIEQALNEVEIKSIIPENILSKYNLMDLKNAYNSVHVPKDEQNIIKAKDRIEIENLLPVLATNENQRIIGKDKRINNYKNITKLKGEFLSLLPFDLTADQNKAIDEIISDLSSATTMNRLLEGDVGSGKTIVALFAAFVAAKNNHQTAIIAPTEILAKQHFETAKKLFSKTDICVCVLTSSLAAQERREVLSKLKIKNNLIVIGTHSLLSNEICFNNLSLTVIDEQHRFGVEQRAALASKGTSVDTLVMSATPIPRSLALVVYGNLDISTLMSRPKIADIQTNIVIKSKQDDMWGFIKEKTQNNSKVFVICAKIDEENENNSILAYSAKNMFDYLCTIFDKENVGLIHGKIKKETQNKIINDFKMGKIKVLVSTTIVEVGVDTDSDIMVIATPERFGLATLHQLRGRIGRDGKKAFCFCLADNLQGKSIDRIKFFKDNTDGFKIAEFDLKTRGAGSIYGTNQHGENDSLISNFSIEAYETAKQIFAELKNYKPFIDNAVAKYNNTQNQKKFSNIVLN